MIHISANDDWLVSLSIISNASARTSDQHTSNRLVDETIRQFDQYFTGQRQVFKLPVAPVKTLRGQVMRDAIASISYGDTASYGQLARQFDSGPRAIGSACRRNPFPIIIPCHRVIAANGVIGHYSAGEGANTKKWLLHFESTQRERTMR
nr:methylated-DNA--[protein]-cysteine S-methyltransferase [Aquisediminimonas sediminicola]